ncbi:PTS sugar transporter subunit IIC, partial [Streptococcus agalactiae]|nr:PTS sugar transporter subunit IIC [Streptococcus agalactiae]
IPFVLIPSLGILISYTATSLGLMSPCVIQVPWTTPVFLSSFLATAGDWRAVIVQLIVGVLGVLIYIPFVKMNDAVVAEQVKK